MNSLKKRDDNLPSTETLAKQGINAAACIAGGLFTLLLQTAGRLPVLGLIAGGIACVIGIVSLLSKDPADKKGGAVISGAGILVMLSNAKIPVVSSVSATLIGIGAAGLLALGIWNGIKFLKGLKKRA